MGPFGLGVHLGISSTHLIDDEYKPITDDFFDPNVPEVVVVEETTCEELATVLRKLHEKGALQ